MRKPIMVLAGLLLSAAAFAATYKDGVDSGAYDALDSHGRKPQMTITVKGGKIGAVSFDDVNKTGALKSRDANDNKAMKAQSGTNPELAYPELIKRLTAKQEAGVDAVTGATSSSGNFNVLAAAILAKVKNGDTSATVLFTNDTYKAEDKFDSRGDKGMIAVTFENGKIVKVTTVDAVSGASSTSQRFIALAKQAIGMR
jgi:major membrane immunogen (membrane-anchored lipoprotein)